MFIFWPRVILKLVMKGIELKGRFFSCFYSYFLWMFMLFFSTYGEMVLYLLMRGESHESSLFLLCFLRLFD